MFNDKPEGGGSGIRKPSIEIAGGTLEPARLPLGKAVGVRFTKKFSKGGQTGYRKVADGIATKGKTRGKMV